MPARVSPSLASNFIVFLVAAFTFSCGSPPAPKAVAAKAPPVVAQPKRYDLRPAPEPKNMIAWGRVSNPAQLLSVAKEWSSLPMPDSAAITQLLAKEPLGAMIDLSRPVDFVATLHSQRGDMKMAYVLSASVASLEDALALARKRHTIRETDPGVFPLGFEVKKANQKHDDDDDDEEEEDDDTDLSCVIAAALGPSPARFICGNALGITELTAYAARTLPSRAVKEGVHVEVSMSVVSREAQSLEEELVGSSSGSSNQARATTRIAKALFSELADFASDVPQLELDLLASSDRVTLQSNIGYQGNKSLLAQLWADRAGKAGPVGEVFWRLPKNSTSAFYWGGYDAKLFGHPRALLMDALREALDGAPLVAGDRSTVVDFADRLLGLVTQASAWAGGDEAKVAKAAEPRRFGRDFGDRARSTLGWQMVVLEDPFATVAPLLRNAAAFWARPSVRKALDLDKKPKTNFETRAPTFVMAPMPKAVPFGKDAVHAVITIYTPDFETVSGTKDSKKGKDQATAVHLFVVADGPRTIVAFGFDETPLAHRVKSALATSPKVGTLAEAQTLDFLRAPDVGYGGFSSMARLLFDSPFTDDDAKSNLEAVSKHPIRFVGRAEAGQTPSTGRVTGAIELDRALVMVFIKFAQQIAD